MGFLEYINEEYPMISNEIFEHIMWSETCYPFGTKRMVITQFLQACRRYKNNVNCCDMCGHKIGYCQCPKD